MPTRIAEGLGYHVTKLMVDLTKQNGGGTFLANGKPIQPTSGYLLSVDENRSLSIPLNEFTPTTLGIWLMNTLTYVIDRDTDDTSVKFLGTWVNPNGTVDLDVVTLIPEREDAIAAALDHDQDAIYDCAAQEAIFVR